MSHSRVLPVCGHEVPKSVPWHHRKDDRQWWRHISLQNHNLQGNKDRRPHQSENGCGTSPSVSSRHSPLPQSKFPGRRLILYFATIRSILVCHYRLRCVRCFFRQQPVHRVTHPALFPHSVRYPCALSASVPHLYPKKRLWQRSSALVQRM